MNTREFDSASLSSDREEEGFSTIEASAVKKIVRESWESRLKERDKATNLEILNAHAAFMGRELNAIDYGTLCMQSIAARAKHMSKGELLAYTKTIEALTLGYKSRFGANFSALLVAGLALVSKDARTLRKHFDYFITHLTEGAGRYDRRIGREADRLIRLDAELAKRNRGVFRFLRKREIARLRSVIKARQIRIRRLEGRKSRYSVLADTIKARATPTAQKKI